MQSSPFSRCWLHGAHFFTANFIPLQTVVCTMHLSHASLVRIIFGKLINSEEVSCYHFTAWEYSLGRCSGQYAGTV